MGVLDRGSWTNPTTRHSVCFALAFGVCLDVQYDVHASKDDSSGF